MAEHELKTWPEYFQAIKRGEKTFELRRNDRDFHVGDVLHLREWTPATEAYTGDSLLVRVTYVLTGGAFGLAEGFAVLGIDSTADEPDAWAQLIRLLDLNYPPDVFPGGDGSDPGPRIVGLIRALRTQCATRTCTRCGDGDLYPRRCWQCGQRWADRACGPTHALITEELGIGNLRRDLAQLREECGRESGAPDGLEYWQDRADAAAASAAERAGQ